MHLAKSEVDLWKMRDLNHSRVVHQTTSTTRISDNVGVIVQMVGKKIFSSFAQLNVERWPSSTA